MAGLFASGQIVDLILALLAMEAIIVIVCHRLTGRGIAPAALLSNLLAGACLLLALRSALIFAWWGWTALWLTAALLGHAADLARRWNR